MYRLYQKFVKNDMICGPYNIRIILRSNSTLWRVKLNLKENMKKICVDSIPCSCGKEYKVKPDGPDVK